MKQIKTFLTLLILLLFQAINGQETARMANIQNQLEVLKVSSPGLSEKTDINITQTTLGNFLMALSKAHSLNINVDPQLNQINVVNDFTDVAVDQVLLFFIKEYNLDIEFTGNILSIKPYQKPPDVEAEVRAFYNPSSQLITLDLKGDRLERVFRSIMDATSKNLLFSPNIQNQPLTLYIKDVPVEVALEKLAATNNLSLKTSRDGFFVFDGIAVATADGAANGSRPTYRRANFFYRVIDTVGKRLEVDFQNTSVADVIYTISGDLGIDVFTASPLNSAGVASVKASDITFDNLLDNIFESAIASTPTVNNGDANSRGGNNRASNTPLAFTYKKEDNLYFFGTEDQLSLKQIEIVRFKHRAIIDFKDPTRSSQNFNNANFVTGGTNFYNQNNFNPTPTTRNTSGSSSGMIAPVESIQKIIPDEIKSGLDITTDYELNGFVVSGPGVKVEKFKEFIRQIDVSIPLIYIEVMILELNRSAILETGISFGIGDQPVQTQGSIFPSTDITIGANTINQAIAGTGGLGALNIGKVVPEFYLNIQANEENGNLKILSTPQLSALNGHSAFLSSSQTSYYAITNQTIIGSQNPQTTEIRNYAPVAAELALDIRPIVTDGDNITLDIKVVQSSFSGERIEEDAPPDINTREFSSIVRMKDQEMVILGGIEQIVTDDSGSGVPFLARVPIIKWLFSKRRREDTKRSLTILIKPTVIN